MDIALGFAIGAVGGALGGALVGWARGKALDAEVKIAYFLSTAGEGVSGFEIADRTDIRAGTVYSVLAKFELMGMVTTVQDEPDAQRMWLWTAGPMKTKTGEV